jgi:hypothetical protein
VFDLDSIVAACLGGICNACVVDKCTALGGWEQYYLWPGWQCCKGFTPYKLLDISCHHVQTTNSMVILLEIQCHPTKLLHSNNGCATCLTGLVMGSKSLIFLSTYQPSLPPTELSTSTIWCFFTGTLPAGAYIRCSSRRCCELISVQNINIITDFQC